MLSLLKTPVRAAGTLFAAALMVTAQAPGATIARPGTVNYIEGEVTLNGRALGAKSLGSTEVAPGQVLATAHGNAEMLLTPGVFLRLDNNSAVKMVSPSITDTRVELLRGKAMVEAAQVEKENHLVVQDNGASTVLEKHGLYEFNANQPAVAVYEGKAKVEEDDHTVDVGKGKELPLQPTATAKLKPEKFDRKDTDSLYAWSKLRSEYLAEANQSSVRTILASGPSWYYGTGWYWNPYFDTFAFVPGAGYWGSPFGWGFYSPAYFSYYPPFYGYYGGYGGYRGGRIWRGGRVAGSTGAVTARPPAAVGGSGVRFGPSAAPRAAAPATHAPAMGGGGVRFGGRR
ncbi:MAG: FecR domain-containing protein [Acidobacteriia bacterium]|nr:FecR domain-containing protein [Terriglobia bacterium]